MREVTEAHYLHEKHGLEAVLRPPVRNPSALAWIPRKEILIVGTRDGRLVSVDPVLGTRTMADDVGEPAEIAIHPDRQRYVVLARGGHWQVGKLGGDVLFRGRHGFLSGMQVFFLGDYVVMVGDEVEGRALLVVRDGEIKARARLPERVVPLSDEKGRGLLLARSTPSGLTVIGLGKGERFPKGTSSTVHRLRFSHSWVIGLTPTGVCVWGREGGTTDSMRLPDLTVGDISQDGRYLGLGTRNGVVALARLDMKDRRVRPDLVKAFDAPVTSVAFSTRGRWLATGSDGLQLWSWED